MSVEASHGDGQRRMPPCVSDQQLEGYVDGTSGRLAGGSSSACGVVSSGHATQLSRLSEIRNQQGTLEPDQDALWSRCDRFIKKLKGLAPKRPQRGRGG